ncbi:hypothetical protein PAHAL_9G131100 [Panicum hallii]|uniref:NB-ARC domain-containing protein n=1 Tax=Panicum hallii TaxID=206008 RepID=A0A2S3IJA0_9POAL|nr:disease resistance protein RGA2-like [Panicum hallii]XP_025793434.1 disease resistance protein RGA2-like [Panicum hallii]PAN45622.1 hypothetical protein PAHAL_9G131100 [Panicum hallii]
MLEAFALRLAAMLFHMARQETDMLLGVPGEISKLQRIFSDLSRILVDAERNHICNNNATVGNWVSELRDAMYDMDNVLDKWQILQWGKKPSTSSMLECCKISLLFCHCNPGGTYKIGRKIQALNKRLEDIMQRSKHFDFISKVVGSSRYLDHKAVKYHRKSGSSIIRSDIVGEKVEQDTRMLVNYLLSQVDTRAKCLDISTVVVSIAIVGLGGIGKTTLARMIFNDSAVEDMFDKRIWLSVNQDVDETDVLHRVLAALDGKYNYRGFVGDKDQLECAVKCAVRHKKFLLVMDDVWSDSIWNELLRVPLNDGAPGSQVLVTTRNHGVACRMKAQLFHHIDKLNPEDCWSLLKKVLFNDEDKSEIVGLEDIGMDIVKRCDGLPLAVKVVGGLLLSRSRRRGAWMDILDHSAWSLMSDDLNNAVFLSYEELSPPLKQCFLQCSLIPKSKVIQRRTIVQMWIAEGFVRDDTGSQLPEDLGIEYYKELISRNLIEYDTQIEDQSGWIMHDVVRSFAQYVIRDEGLLVSEGKSIDSSVGNLKFRCLSVSTKEVDCASLQKQKSLRTLMLFGTATVELKFLLNKFPYLRVLHLQDADVAELPQSICDLRHLRYLGLEGTGITTIPRGIGNLKFLQHMALNRCKNLMQLPDSIVQLQHLMSLNIRGTKISSIVRGFGNLQNLVQLWGFPTNLQDKIGDRCSLGELGPLSKLKLLTIEGLEKAFAGSMVAEAKLSSKSHLTQLELKCGSMLKDRKEVEADRKDYHTTQIEEVFDDLCPPPCIEDIVLTGYFGHQVPKWMARMAAFQNLRLLVIRDYPCCKQLPSGLGQIPFLDYIRILHAPSIESIGHEFLLPSFGSDGTGTDETSEITETSTGTRQPCHLSCDVDVAFPKLRELVLDQLMEWREWYWDEQVQAMPVLQSLRIDSCKLNRLPPGLACQARSLRKLCLVNILHLVSVENFPSLVELHLSQNPELQRVTNNSSLQKIEITNCPAVVVLEDLPALQSITWDDLDAETLPEYLREVEIKKLDVKCSLTLLQIGVRSSMSND